MKYNIINKRETSINNIEEGSLFIDIHNHLYLKIHTTCAYDDALQTRYYYNCVALDKGVLCKKEDFEKLYPYNGTINLKQGDFGVEN